MTDKQLTSTFDYSQLDAETSALCHRTAQIATTFMQYTRRTIDKGIELGEHLIRVKDSLPHGQYMPYVASIGVPYQVAAYWTRAIKTQRQIDAGEIFDIKYLPEPQSENLDIKDLADIDQQEIQGILENYDLETTVESTDIDVAATVTRNKQLEEANQELQKQLQQALQQGNGAIPAPTRHYGGGYHGPAKTVEQDNGVAHKWNYATRSHIITSVVREIGAGKGGFTVSVQEDIGNPAFIFFTLEFSSPKLNIEMRMERAGTWNEHFVRQLEDGIRQVKQRW